MLLRAPFKYSISFTFIFTFIWEEEKDVRGRPLSSCDHASHSGLLSDRSGRQNMFAFGSREREDNLCGRRAY